MQQIVNGLVSYQCFLLPLISSRAAVEWAFPHRLD